MSKAIARSTGGSVKTEDDPLDPTPPPGARETNAAIRYLDQAVTDAGGIALRCGPAIGASGRSFRLGCKARLPAPLGTAQPRPRTGRRAAESGRTCWPRG
jgi:hypothetical protein